MRKGFGALALVLALCLWLCPSAAVWAAGETVLVQQEPRYKLVLLPSDKQTTLVADVALPAGSTATLEYQWYETLLNQGKFTPQQNQITRPIAGATARDLVLKPKVGDWPLGVFRLAKQYTCQVRCRFVDAQGNETTSEPEVYSSAMVVQYANVWDSYAVFFRMLAELPKLRSAEEVLTVVFGTPVLFLAVPILFWVTEHEAFKAQEAFAPGEVLVVQ